MAQSAPNSQGQRVPFEERLDISSKTDVGQARAKNEDNLGEASPDETGRGWFFVVADGMGGAVGGATASGLAVENAKAGYCEYMRSKPLESPFGGLTYAVERANQSIFDRSRTDESCYGMGTTIVVMAIIGDMVYTAHVGDSRIYRYRDGRLEKMMRDHTRVQMLSDQGIITPAEANHHPESHVINRNLGGRPDVEVDTPADGPFPLMEGDTYLLCSDGLHGLVPDDTIRRVLDKAPPKHASAALVELANRRGGYDNITVSLVTAGKGPAAWEDFDEVAFRKLVDELALEETSDTALFEAHDPDSRAPAEFETQRLKAIAAGEPIDRATGRSTAPKKGEEDKPKGQASRNTVMLDEAEMGGMFAAMRAADAVAATSPSPGTPAESLKKGISPLVIVLLLALLFTVALVAVLIIVLILK